MFVGEPGEFKSVWRRARFVTTHQFKQGRVQFPVCERADMGEARKPSLHAFNKRNRVIVLAEGP